MQFSMSQYLVFDSKFTNYENLSRLDDKRIKFVIIQGKVSFDAKGITVDMKKRRDLPLILE